MAEKKVIELEVKNNLGSLKSQLREAQAEVARLSEQFGVTSKQVIEAAKRAADLKDRIEDANDAIQAFKGEGAFLATGKAINAATSGIAAYEGALGILGVESEKVQETLLKVQSAMALTQGLAGLEDAGRAFTQLGAVIKNQVVTAFTTLKGAIIATGIGALVVTIGFLLPKIMEWIDGTKELERRQNALNHEIDKANIKYQKNTEEIDRNLNAELRLAKARGASEQEQLNIEKKFGKERVQVQQRTVAELDKLLKEKRNMYIEAYVDEDWDRAKALNKEYKDLQAQRNAILKAKKNQNEDLKLQQEELNLTLTKNQKDAQKERLKEQQEINKELLKAQIELQNEVSRINAQARNQALTELEQANTEANDRRLSTQQKEVQDVNDKYFRLIELAKQYNEDTKSLEQAQLEELDLIRSKYNLKQIEDKNNLILEIETVENAYFDSLKTRQDLEVQAVSDKYFRLIELAKQNGEDTKVLEQAQAQEIAKIKLDAEKELNAKKVQMTQQAFSVIQGVADLFAQGNEEDQRRAFEINKAANLGLAIVNTAQAVTGALTAGGNPIKLATGMQFVEAGLVGTIGALNIAKIANTQFQGGGASSGGGNTPTATAPRTPSFDIIQAQPQMQLGALQQQPIKAYVVSGEVSTAQALDRNRVRNATF